METPRTEAATRRAFLRQATALTLAIPGIGAALEACTTEHGTAAEQAPAQGAVNPDSKLDTALPAPAGTGGAISPAAAAAKFQPFAAALPPAPAPGVQTVHFHAREATLRLGDDLVVSAWTFEGNVPGPILHARVGDTVEFTLTNEALMPHSMDFHAAQVDPKTAFRSAVKGQSVSYRFTPKRAGCFLYHCGTAPVLLHLGSGMFGAIVVSPRTPLPPAREFVIVQSELYLGAGANGVRPFDYQRMLSTLPDYVVFNGRPDQYGAAPLRAKRGERVRFWVANAGPTHPCAFHIVGEQFETVYLGEPPANAIHGVQTWSVPAGGGMGFELVADVPGEFAFVNHSFGHGQKGAIGRLVVEAG